MHQLFFSGAGSDLHHRDCDALTREGVTVPFAHAPATAGAAGRPHDRWCTVRDAAGRPVAGGVLRVTRSRKLPWIRLARLEQAGALVQAAGSLLDGGTRDLVAACEGAIPWLGRLTVQCYALDANALDRQRDALAEAGFRATDPVGYTRTLRLALPADEAALRQRLTGSARRNVRELDDSGYAVRPLGEPAWGPRLQALLQASHTRTGGGAASVDWSTLLRAAATDPGRSVILGLFHPARSGQAALVGFAQGVVTDGAVSYAVAGTERAADIGRVPLSYALLWELLRWAMRGGHTWFDFGGVTPADQPEHPLAGISAFKRRFGGEECVAAAELSVAPHAAAGRLLAAADTLLRQGAPDQSGA